MSKKLPYPFQFVWFMSFIVFFTMALYFTADSMSMMLAVNGWSYAGLNWDLPILLDTMSLLFAATVSLISSAIFTFGRTYMRDELITNDRFWGLVILFVLSMFMVIFIPNLLMMMIGWDGLGMSSFLLVIHYQNTESLYGGYITILSNRAGDAMLLLVVGILGSAGSSYSIFMDSNGPGLNTSALTQMGMEEYVALSLLCMAAYSKSAQLPFNAWLPEAMAAPTPVSALVHSSTLVTAGVYLLIRTFDFWSSWPLVAVSMTATGMVTMLIGGGKATIEGDVKKTIAFSTMSQLGYMVAILGLGHPSIAFFHLLTHALFKSTIFMSAGTIFAYGHHYQIYDQWNSKWHMPIAGVGLGISLAAMNVFPYLAGMYSKELIVSTATAQVFTGTHINLFYFSVATLIIASTQTMIYTVRLWRGLMYTKYTARAYYFFEKPAYRPEIYTVDNNTSLRLPFLALVLGTITGGSVVMWVLLTPSDLSPMPWGLKIVVALSVIAGTCSAFMPCRGVTKMRVNQRVYSVRASKKQLLPHVGVKKFSWGMKKTGSSNFLCSGIGGDYSHIHDGAQWFMDRAFFPVYRVFYLAGKLVYLVEQGVIQLWSLSTPSYSVREASIISQNMLNHLNWYVGVVFVLFTFGVLLLI